MAVTFEGGELRTFVADLERTPRDVTGRLRAVVEKGAHNIMTQHREEMGASRAFGQIARFITYDIREGVSGVEAEIGPVKGGWGSLANIAYFGTWKGGGGVKDPAGALEAEAPRFMAALEKAVTEALR